MKSLWNLISVLAVTNLLALLMFVGWLWQSGRLDSQRVQEARRVFAEPIASAPGAGAAEAVAASEALHEQASTSHATGLSESIERLPTSAAQIELIARLDERAALASRRVADEQGQLMAQLEARQVELQHAVARFHDEKAAWEAAVKTEQERRIDEQFLKAVKQLESVPPKQGKKMIVELVAQGSTRQAVSYLDAMDPRAAKKVLSEFKEDAEIALATQLLEKLRTFGTPAEGDTEPSDADRVAATAEPRTPDA